MLQSKWNKVTHKKVIYIDIEKVVMVTCER